MSFNLTAKEAQAALDYLRTLRPARPKEALKMSRKETVFFMAPELLKLTRKGFTLKELTEGLEAQKISLKPATLNRYLNEYKVGRAKAAIKTAAQALATGEVQPPAAAEPAPQTSSEPASDSALEEGGYERAAPAKPAPQPLPSWLANPNQARENL